MAYRGNYQGRVIGSVLLMGLLSLPNFTLAADSECATVKDCAEQMVAAAARLKGENEQLRNQINELQTALDKQKTDLNKAIDDQIAAIKTKDAPDQYLPAGDIGKMTKYCDKGSYMIGITFADQGGGAHGSIYAVQPVCRKM
ncbi:bZIP transcription factor [Rhizobium leguminosarum]|uniref:bZIP transcription factor n=1 Tax=Rhizobium leguminosarum TaxID=384 RepID=UPI00038133A5|nr:bZIP transcription factor [Rhizobium leguminosarum]